MSGLNKHFTPSFEWCQDLLVDTKRLSNRFPVGYAHTAGRKKDSNTGERVMEDVVLVNGSFSNDDDLDLFCIFDGHDGSEAAQFAARTFSRLLEDKLFQVINMTESEIDAETQNSAIDVTPQTLITSPNHRRIILTIHKTFISLANELRTTLKRANSFSGTTALVTFLYQNTLYVANVGDTRAVLAKNPSTWERVSVDHRPDSQSERQRIEQRGGTVQTIAGSVPRVNGLLAVSRALGNIELEGNGVISTPSIRVIENIFEYQFLILASDGIWDPIPEPDVVRFVAKELGYVKAFVPKWKQRQQEEDQKQEPSKQSRPKQKPKKKSLETSDLTFSFDEEVESEGKPGNLADDDDEIIEEIELDTLETTTCKKLIQMAYEKKTGDNISVIVLNLAKKETRAN